MTSKVIENAFAITNPSGNAVHGTGTSIPMPCRVPCRFDVVAVIQSVDDKEIAAGVCPPDPRVRAVTGPRSKATDIFPWRRPKDAYSLQCAVVGRRLASACMLLKGAAVAGDRRGTGDGAT